MVVLEKLENELTTDIKVYQNKSYCFLDIFLESEPLKTMEEKNKNCIT